ncbi:hypothetical protein H2200_013182 [Cladophialophora chaetospira]|uniref:Carboxylesterase type B domain-containing protein n=1 Tax=Cladophialophora chaetospira TaxID=386627 RepID=A0AA38WWC9_9EURO|nr:hypothetical protein H2200_013182 [Cladophialophora chaetospira]
MATSLTTYTHDHPLLGPLTGRLTHSYSTEIVHFRSIPYATVRARFKPSTPLTSIPRDFDHRPYRDFTTYGAACPQAACEIVADGSGSGMGGKFHTAYGGPLEDDVSIWFDDLRCTNLSLAVPKGLLSGGKKVPVLVYVHGGGMAEGVGHVDGLHAGVRLAGLGAKEGMETVVVNIGYRLNWFGFLTCDDVLQEAKEESRRGGGEVFNQGLHDQQKAFRWLKRFVAGFGGDPEDITAFGESAGSISLTYHLCGSEALFRRVILMSSGIWGQSTFEEKEQHYNLLLQGAGIQAETGEERLAALTRMDGITLGKIGPAMGHVLPYCREDRARGAMFDRGEPLYANQFDLKVDLNRFLASVRTVMGNRPLVDDVLVLYEELSESTPWALAWPEIARFLGDVYITEVMHTLAEELSKAGKRVYQYTFALTNPWPGSDCSYVTGHHFAEILFIFLTLTERYPKGRDKFLQRQAEETARRWIAFAHGKEPWTPYRSPEGMVAVCDDLVGWSTRTKQEDTRISEQQPWGTRRYKATELIRKIWREMEEEEGAEAVEEARKHWLTHLSELLAPK